MGKKFNLIGTKTYDNLLKAFEGESKAAMRYFHFADEAGDDGFKYLEYIFLDTMRNEQEHAEEFMEYLGMIEDTVANLKLSIAIEGYEAALDYPAMAKTAREEGFEEIAKKFEAVALIEQSHKERFEKYLNLIETNSVFKRRQRQRWECMKCGHVHEGLEPPEKCPFCGHKRKYFKIKNENY